MHQLLLVILAVASVPVRSFLLESFGLDYLENPDGTINATYDCSVNKHNWYIASLWSSDIPSNIRSLSIQNCKLVTLDILQDAHSNNEETFTHLNIRNVTMCTINGGIRRAAMIGTTTTLPIHSTFTDIYSLSINVPLYNSSLHPEREISLEFRNVAMDRLKSYTIPATTFSVKKMSMNRVKIMTVEECAIRFSGAYDSVFEMENSFIATVPENFIQCTVTQAILKTNNFMSVRRGSVSVTSDIFDFTGNSIGSMFRHGFKITTSYVSIQNNRINLVGNGPLQEISAKNYESNLAALVRNNTAKDVDESGSGIDEYFQIKTVNKIWESSSSSSFGASEALNDRSESGKHEAKEKTRPSSVLGYLTSNIYLLWFLSVSVLVLTFPLAYLIKIYFFKMIDNVFPPVINHERLTNEVDDDDDDTKKVRYVKL